VPKNAYNKIFASFIECNSCFWRTWTILTFTPKIGLIELKYRNQPSYVDALKKAMADPENTELWDKVEIERQKMDNVDYQKSQE